MDDNKSYCFDIAVNTIYKGAPKYLLSSKESTGSVIDDWSPNNIRRLVISPDGILVQRYVTSSKCPKLIDIALFKDSNKYTSCASSEGYKPISKALSYLRVCSCLEEIVYLTKSERGMQLPVSELKITDYHKSLKRLHSRVILPMTLKEFSSSVAGKLGSCDYQICEDDDLAGKQVELKVKDWWKYYSLRPVYYKMDAEGSKLSKYFIDTENKMESSIKSDKVKKLNNERFGTKSEKLKKECSQLDVMLKCLSRFNKLEKTNGRASYVDRLSLGSTLYLSVASDVRNLVSSYDIQDLDELSSTCKAFLKSLGVSLSPVKKSAEVYDIHIDMVSKLRSTVYLSVLKYTLVLCKSMSVKMPITTRTLVGRTERVLMVPDNLKEYSKGLDMRCGLSDTGVLVMSSYYNCFVLCCLLLFTPSQKFTLHNGGLHIKYNKDYWMSLGGVSHADR